MLAELHAGYTLLVGSSTTDQLQRIMAFVGTPSRADVAALHTTSAIAAAALERLPRAAKPRATLPADCRALVLELLRLDPARRVTAQAALQHADVARWLDEAQARAVAASCAAPTAGEMARLTPQLGDHESVVTYRSYVNSHAVSNPIANPSARGAHEAAATDSQAPAADSDLDAMGV